MRQLRKLVCGVVCACAATGETSDPSAMLMRRVTDAVMKGTTRTPNYTCVETIQRDYYKPLGSTLPRSCPVLLAARQSPTPDLGLRLVSSDRLRLDVAMVERGEIFSWAGASRFENVSLDEVVHYGPIASGFFGGFLSVVFGHDAKEFVYRQETWRGGRRLLEYAWEVAREDSHYRVRMERSWYRTAYSGTIEVDPETAELVHMTVRTRELPQATGSCQTISEMDVAPVRIGTGEFLLPQGGKQRFVSTDGSETENTTTFSNCREYRGESTITYAEPGAASDGAERGAEDSRPLPTGLRFTCALAKPIDTRTAAAGDPFTARLTEPLRDQQGRVLALTGSRVEGRILRVETFQLPEAAVVVVMQPNVLHAQGNRMRLAAVRDWGSARQTRHGTELVLPRRGEWNAGAFRLKGEPAVLGEDFVTDWRTVLVNTDR
jgi:hypothetical protein